MNLVINSKKTICWTSVSS